MKLRFLLILFVSGLISINGITQQKPFLAGEKGDNILFTDIDPDTTHQLNQYLIDFDNNGINDFKITDTIIEGGMMSESIFTAISGLNKNKIIFGYVDTAKNTLDSSICGIYKIVKLFNFNDTIHISNDTCSKCEISLLIWDNIFNCHAEASPGANMGPKYIGLILNRNDSIVFGWLEVNLPTDYLTLMEYASEIKGITQIQKMDLDGSIKIFPNPTIRFLNILLPSAILNNGYKISLFNILGIKIFEKKIKEIDYVFDMVTLANGIYIMNISDNSNIYFRQKILKNK